MRLFGSDAAYLEPPARETHRKLVWVTFLRLLIVLALLAATAVLTFTERDSLSGPVQGRLYGLAAVVSVGSALFLLLLRFTRQRFLPALAYAQVVSDVGMAAYLVWLTGGNESIFAFLFSLGVINAAILRYRRGALVGAALSALAFAALTFAMQARLLLPAAAYLGPASVPLPRLVFTVAVHGAAVFIVAALASWLTEQLRRTGEQLTVAKEDYAAVSTLLESVVQSVASGILTLDEGGRVTFVNRAGEELLGLSQARGRGRLLAELAPDFAAALPSGGPAEASRGETALPSREGTRQLGFTASPLRSTERETAGRVVIFQDLTAMRHLEELAQRNERLAALGTVAAGLAHEVRNPLGSMSGAVELLRAALPEGADEARLLEIVLREAERLDGLLTDFLHFARPIPPEPRPVAMAFLIAETLEVLSHDPMVAGCQVEVEAAPELVLELDPGQFKQVLMNLVLNAAQAVSGAGRISITAQAREEAMHLRVADDGPGLAPEVARRIFDPFFTTKERGSGLGLALVHRVVEAHGGTVQVRSESGGGCLFSLVVPMQTRRLEPTGTEGD